MKEWFKINCDNCKKNKVICHVLKKWRLALMVMDPRSIAINDYIYLLPEDRIAKYPLVERDAAKLLIYRNGEIAEDSYRNIGNYLPEESLLVFNNTKVIEARLLFQKPSGAVIEIFCLEPHEQYADITTGMLQQGRVLWKCLIGGASKWKTGQVLHNSFENNHQSITLQAKYIEKQTDCFIIELSWTPKNLSFAEVLHLAGFIPLPPYIKRKSETSDKERYQTIYAALDGSVAAPTAGLHFTPAIFDKLKSDNIRTGFVTLHVGAGTFKPVKSEIMQGHEMHAEFIDVSIETIRLVLKYQNNIFSVGTTSLRTLESIYWMGSKTVQEPTINIEDLFITQWEVYDKLQQNKIPAREALQSLLLWMDKNKLSRLLSKTQILIAPGYHFRLVKGLITNFHQPQSTLLLLVAAFIGDDWRKVYDYALKNGFRFLSYGDGSLLFLRSQN
jgi:S-adenosylmethionine:tRNA ribosyltransferase-isomerase